MNSDYKYNRHQNDETLVLVVALDLPGSSGQISR